MTTAPQPVTIAVTDGQPIFREGLKRLLLEESGFEVVGLGEDGRDAIRLVETHAPDVLLIDLVLPRLPGLEVLRALRSLGGPTRPIVLSAVVQEAEAIEALRLGARGIVLKDTPTALLMKCIRLVAAGQFWVGREGVSSLVGALRQTGTARQVISSPFGLTPRQLQIVAAVASGATNRQIATQLTISEETVKQHIASAFDKCGVSSRVELALFAVHHKLVES